MSEPVLTFDASRFEQLVADRCNGALSENELAELEQILASSAEARQRYWQSISVHAALKWEFAGEAACLDQVSQLAFESAEASFKSRLAPPSSGSRVRATHLAWSLPLAVCLLVATTVAWVKIGNSVDPAQLTDRAHSSKDVGLAQQSGNVIGNLTALLPDTHWSFGKSGGRNRRSFTAGETIWLDRGAAELQLTNGTIATLEAPLIFQLDSLDRARVLRGRISVCVASGAEGFIVDTAAAEVVDLGTTFSVEVGDKGATDVIVFEGRVDLKLPPQNSESDELLASDVKHLHMGDAIRVHTDGTTSRIVQVQQTDFQSKQQRPPVVSSVRDNLSRDSGAWLFYEIVPCGMGEDVRAFVDRDHEWNGIDARGLPIYLRGGDYVKTFNVNKISAQLSMTVTLDRPCMLYVLIDKRVSPPQWVVDSFEPTGDDVGVDETSVEIEDDARGSKHVSGRGPGKSIDEKFSVWARRIDQPGEVVLGRNAPDLGDIPENGESTGVSMYGIVATPLNEPAAN